MLALLAAFAFAQDPAPTAPTAGIGASLSEDAYEEQPGVALPLPGSPAERAGLRVGDLVTAVDGWETKDKPLTEVIAKIAGAEGTPVKLSILRDGARSDITITRAPVKALAEAQVKREAELCPAIQEAIRGRKDSFAALRGELLSEEGEGFKTSTYAAKTPMPGATRTFVQDRLGATWIAELGSPGSPEASARALESVVTAVRPCLRNMWVERELEEGRPVWYFGYEHALGWYEGIGAFRVRSDGVIDVYVSAGGDPTLYLVYAADGAPSSAWGRALGAVVAAAPDEFKAIRGAALPSVFGTEHAVTQVMPGALRCSLQDMMQATYECVLAENTDAAGVNAAYDATLTAARAALGRDWLYWFDTKPGAHGRHAVHLARRTTRGYEQGAIVTITPEEKGVTLTVVWDGLT